MYLIDNKISLLDDLLNRIAVKLQLDRSRREKAETSYSAVIRFLENDEKFFSNLDINIYPQGSYRLGTTVKPKSGDEYDLDFVLEVNLDYKKYNPLILLDNLERRLRESEVYVDKIERKKRCVGINYKNDFHLDVIPATPKKFFGDDDIKISDRKLISWLDSSPKGYIKWFESNYIDKKLLLEKAAAIEKLPDQKPYEFIQPLQRVVQLFKRNRDIYFEDKNEDYKTRSIVLTTLAGHYYNLENSENIALSNILTGIYNKVLESSNPFEIVNPANPNEKFSDLWTEKPHLFEHFKSFINDIYTKWRKLNEQEGIAKVGKILEELFGESVSREVISEQAEYVNALKKKGLLKTTALGTITTSSEIKSSSIPPNTNYGEI